MPVIGYLCPSWKKEFQDVFWKLKNPSPESLLVWQACPPGKGTSSEGCVSEAQCSVFRCVGSRKRSTKYTPWCCQSRGGTQRESAWPFPGVYPQADPLLSFRAWMPRPAVGGVLSPSFSAVVQSRLLLAQVWENHLRRQHPEMRSHRCFSAHEGPVGPGLGFKNKKKLLFVSKNL